MIVTPGQQLRAFAKPNTGKAYMCTLPSSRMTANRLLEEGNASGAAREVLFVPMSWKSTLGLPWASSVNSGAP